jgi:hypothetical protein
VFNKLRLPYPLIIIKKNGDQLSSGVLSGEQLLISKLHEIYNNKNLMKNLSIAITASTPFFIFSVNIVDTLALLPPLKPVLRA